MAVPKFHEFFREILEIVSDQQEHSIRELIHECATRLKVTEQDRKERLPSGKQFTLDNRVGWAKTYLLKAGLVESPRRAHIKITELGTRFLADAPEIIKPSDLKKFESFREFHSSVGKPDPEAQEQKISSKDTPDEQLAFIHTEITDALAKDLLEKVREREPSFFEQLVVELLVKMGYGGSFAEAGLALGGSNDGGVDGMIKEDKLGLDRIYIQAKRYQEGAHVGRPEVQAFAGALEGKRAHKGVFITTSHFSIGAREYVESIQKRIVLIDGTYLAKLMIEHDIGTSVKETYYVKEIDNDFFDK